MNISEIAQKIRADHPECPVALRRAMAQGEIAAVWAIGNLAILEAPLLGLFCSKKCPGDIIIKTFDLIRQLRDAGVPMIGGFHSPMGKECLELLQRGRQQVVMCPARNIKKLRFFDDWKQLWAEGRLLILSPFEGTQNRRTTAELAQQRNRFVGFWQNRFWCLMPHLRALRKNFCGPIEG